MPYYNCTFVDDRGAYFKKVIFSESKSELVASFANADEKLLYARRNFFKNTNITKIFQKKIGYWYLPG